MLFYALLSVLLRGVIYVRDYYIRLAARDDLRYRGCYEREGGLFDAA